MITEFPFMFSSRAATCFVIEKSDSRGSLTNTWLLGVALCETHLYSALKEGKKKIKNSLKDPIEIAQLKGTP